MGLVTSAAEMLRLFREGDTDGNGRIDCDEFIALGKKVDVFSGAAEAFTTKDQGVVKKRRASQRIKVRKGSGLGPILSIDSERKVFESTVGKNIEQTVTMTNSGSCALYYEWVRRPIAVPGLGTSAAVDAANQFFVPRVAVSLMEPAAPSRSPLPLPPPTAPSCPLPLPPPSPAATVLCPPAAPLCSIPVGLSPLPPYHPLTTPLNAPCPLLTRHTPLDAPC